MRFHGFQSVDAWLAEFQRLRDYPWQVYKQRWARISFEEFIPCAGISMKTLPYGDKVDSIQEDDPDELLIVVVTGNTPSASTSAHLFSVDLSTYYAYGDESSMLDALQSWGFVPSDFTSIAEIA